MRVCLAVTLAAALSVYTLLTVMFLHLLGCLSILSAASLIVSSVIAQLAIAPRIIDAALKVRELKPEEFPMVDCIVEELSAKIDLRKPKVFISDVPLPISFSYGSPFTGSRLAITSRLLDVLNTEELAAVLSHELGHLKNRDVQVTTLLSFLPSVFYYFAGSLLISTFHNNVDARCGSFKRMMLLTLGALSLSLYLTLLLSVIGLSRIREHYADQYASFILEDGSEKLSRALEKIAHTIRGMRLEGQPASIIYNCFKPLYIYDPDCAERDSVRLTFPMVDGDALDRVLKKRLTLIDRLLNFFSTHPNLLGRVSASGDLTDLHIY